MKAYFVTVLYALAFLSCPLTSSLGKMQDTSQPPTEKVVLAVETEIKLPTFCVTAHVLTLRTGPGISFQPITWLLEGTQAIQLSSVGNWSEVTSDQYHGFVNSTYLGDCP